MEHKIKEIEGFDTVGIGVDCNCMDPETGNKARKVWEDFCKRLGEIKNREGREWVSTSKTIGECDFRYVAGVKIKENSEIPEGMESVKIMPGKYAVFPYTGPIEELGKFYGEMVNYMKKEGLVEDSTRPWIELYPKGFEEGESFNIYIPIK